MRVVHKVVIDLRAAAPIKISIGFDAQIVHVQAQHPGDPFQVSVWFDGDDKVLTSRRLEVFGTGHPVPEDAIYLSTHVLMDGALVLHLFEVG